MENTSYLIFLDGEKHSIWNNKKDAIHQVDILKSHYGDQCVSIEELPNVISTNGIYFL